MANSAEIIGKRLYHSGCRRAFGIPGGEVLVLMEGLRTVSYTHLTLPTKCSL